MSWLQETYINQVCYKLARFLVVRTSPLYVANLACPFCGDHESGHKRKAYIFEAADNSEIFFYCHLCQKSVHFDQFLKEMDERLYAEYVFQRMQERANHKESGPSLKFNIKTKAAAVVSPSLLDDHFLRVTELPEKHRAVKYLIGRQLPRALWKELFVAEATEDLNEINPDPTASPFRGNDCRIIIPAYALDKHLVALTARTIQKDNKLRYIDMKFDLEHPIVFGLERVDPNKRYYVTEGPINSFFLPNAIAVGGTDMAKFTSLLPKENAVVVFDNQRRSKELVKIMEGVIAQGLAICFWPSNIIQKDINEMVQAGLDPVSIVDENVASGLEARVKLAEWRKC